MDGYIEMKGRTHAVNPAFAPWRRMCQGNREHHGCAGTRMRRAKETYRWRPLLFGLLILHRTSDDLVELGIAQARRRGAARIADGADLHEVEDKRDDDRSVRGDDEHQLTRLGERVKVIILLRIL